MTLLDKHCMSLLQPLDTSPSADKCGRYEQNSTVLNPSKKNPKFKLQQGFTKFDLQPSAWYQRCCQYFLPNCFLEIVVELSPNIFM